MEHIEIICHISIQPDIAIFMFGIKEKYNRFKSQ
jgi:hypothetical protein